MKDAIQGTWGGSGDAFLTKLNATGSALVYSTYLGGNAIDYGTGIAVDPAGNAYVVGITFSTNFPTVNPFQAAKGAQQDAFVAKINPAGTAWVYATYLGGNNVDEGYGIAADATGNAYVTGYTASTNFPVQSPFRGSNTASCRCVRHETESGRFRAGLFHLPGRFSYGLWDGHCGGLVRQRLCHGHCRVRTTSPS